LGVFSFLNGLLFILFGKKRKTIEKSTANQAQVGRGLVKVVICSMKQLVSLRKITAGLVSATTNYPLVIFVALAPSISNRPFNFSTFWRKLHPCSF